MSSFHLRASALHASILLMAWAGVCVADQYQAPRDIQDAYKSRSYEEVIALAHSYLAERPDSPARYEVAYLAGDAAWERKRFAEARVFLARVVDGGPDVPRWAQAALLMSRILERQDEPFPAGKLASEILSRPVEKRIEKDARGLLEKLAKKSLPPEDLSYIVYNFTQSSLHCRLLERAAAAEADAGRWEELWNLLNRGIDLCGDTGRKTWEKLAPQGLLHRPPGWCKDPYLVGLAFPIKGSYSSYGESIARGASLALDEHNRKARYRLRMALRDTEGDPVRAVTAARTLAADEGVVCVIGALLSSSTAAVAGVTTALGVPLLSPSATREEIARAGPLVFQSTLPRRLQAQALASAAWREIGATSAVVLHPQTPDAELLATAFKERFEELGGKVVTVGYPEDETNFGRLLANSFDPSPGCLFLAGAAKDLAPLIPQLTYYDIRAPVLATEAIASGAVAELAGKHLTKVLYSPDSYALSGEAEARFVKAYEERFGETPDSFAAKGYLALRLVAGALESGARSRSAVAAYMQSRLSDDPALKKDGFLDLLDLEGVEVTVQELEVQER